MRRTAVVRYRTSPESAEHNLNLIKDVLAELTARDPGGLDYLVFQCEDGVGFLHVAVFDGTTDAFADGAAYREFHRDLRQRLAAAPIANRVVLVGSYFGSRCADG